MSESKESPRAAPVVEPLAVSLVSQLVPVVTEKMATAGIALSPSTVMQVLRLAMEAVEGAPIKGEDQKALAINIIMELASNMPDEHKFLIKSLVDGGLINDTIELIVDATRGKLNINKAKAVAAGCFSRLTSVFCRKESEEVKKKRQELKDEKEKQKKNEYREICKTIRDREEERKNRNKEERRKVAKIIKEREEKKQAKKDEKERKKEEKKNRKKGALNISTSAAQTPSGSASVQIPPELSLPALSSNLPDSVVMDQEKKEEGTVV